jgi:N-methylhydantoinase A
MVRRSSDRGKSLDPAEWRLAVDVGGTFTDICAINERTSELIASKIPSSIDDPLASVILGIAASGIALKDVRLVTHSTTITTNALVTRDFPPAAMITTQGFRDVIEIRDGTQQDVWDAYKEVAPPYIKRRNRFEVDERIDYSGRALTPLDVSQTETVAQEIVRRGVKTVAVCLLNSYANPIHELQVREVLLSLNATLSVTLSSETLPEVNEYERFSTTVANSLLGSLVTEYIGRLDAYLREHGYQGDLLLMHSGGGSMTADLAQRYPLRLAASSIAGGAMAARHIAQQCGFTDAISLDMGGTSTDITLIQNGQVRVSKQWWVEYGHPISFPGVELSAVGAGGGTIAWIDGTGGIRSGPHSAGSTPGPVSYGRGGVEPTNTDANLLLGRLGAELADGAISLDVDAAQESMRVSIGEPLSLSVPEAALAVLEIADSAVSGAVRLLKQSRRSLSPSAPMIVFGGAGPMHGAAVARELDIPLVIIPPNPGITSALGCLLVDVRHDFTAMYHGIASDLEPSSLENRFLDLETDARARLRKEGISEADMVLERSVDLRYRGQWRSMNLPFGRGKGALKSAVQLFQAEYQAQFSYLDGEAPVEIYQLGLTAIGRLPTIEFPHHPLRGGKPSPRGSRNVTFNVEEGPQQTDVYDRSRLSSGMTVSGPCIIEQADATTVIPPEYEARVDPWLNLHLSLKDV